MNVNANSKFNTNLPLDRAMLVNKLWWNLTQTKFPAWAATSDLGEFWQVNAQLTEALARTATAATDPVFVDQMVWEYQHKVVQSSAVGIIESASPTIMNQYTEKALFNPWLTAAQQLNLVVSVNQIGTAVNGPNVSVLAIVEYQLIALTAELRNYLATRVQIAGQA